jgi:hypothetical protein
MCGNTGAKMALQSQPLTKNYLRRRFNLPAGIRANCPSGNVLARRFSSEIAPSNLKGFNSALAE